MAPQILRDVFSEQEFFPHIGDRRTIKKTMVTFLFWNLGNRRIENLVARLAVSKGVDILILAEMAASPREMLLALNSVATNYDYATGDCEKVRILLDSQVVFLWQEERRSGGQFAA